MNSIPDFGQCLVRVLVWEFREQLVHASQSFQVTEKITTFLCRFYIKLCSCQTFGHPYYVFYYVVLVRKFNYYLYELNVWNLCICSEYALQEDKWSRKREYRWRGERELRFFALVFLQKRDANVIALFVACQSNSV